MAILRDGVRSAVRVGRSRKAEKCFLTDVNISWGQQVAVMFQIVSTLMEEVPDFALMMQELRGEQPRIQLLKSGRYQYRPVIETAARCLDGGWPEKDPSRTNVLRPLFASWGKDARSDIRRTAWRTMLDRRAGWVFR